jgi:hypothetical protein
LCAYINYLQDGWVHWLPLAEFSYNNSVHASTGVTPSVSEKGFYSSIEATVWASTAKKSVLNVPSTTAEADRLVELWAAIK